MQSKARVLSELVATRNIIKSKFRQAYSDRMKRERVMKEVLKPVTSAITTLKPTTTSTTSSTTTTGKKKKKNSQSNDESENIPSSEETVSLSSTPQPTPPPSSFGEEYKKFKTYESDSSYKLTRKKIPKTSLLPIPTPARTSASKPYKYTYEVEHDNQDLKNYNKTPPDDVTVTVTKTNKITGEMTPTRMLWKDVPKASKDAWVRTRKRLFEFSQQPAVAEAFEKHSRKMDVLAQSPILTSDLTDDDSPNTSKLTRRLRHKKRQGRGLKTNSNSIDFNFIPYNINNRIIYEYFDDPNELCDRLRLLVSSRMAGNTNHMQEINSIIEELRELKCIV